MTRPADALTSTLDAVIRALPALGDAETSRDDSSEAWLDVGAALERLAASDSPSVAILDVAIESIGAERGFLLVRGTEDWETLAARTFEGEDVLHPMEKVIRPLIERSVERGEGYHSPELLAEDEWANLERQRSPRTHSLWILPLPDGAGVLYLDHRFQAIDSAAGLHSIPTIVTLLTWLHERSERVRTVDHLRDELKRARARARGRGEPTIVATPDSETGAGAGPLIIGEHPEILEIQELIDRVAPSDAPVLITGESGTGKELVAKAIHLRSPRADQSFVSENCGAITETLLESELFGCVKGAYTGADEDRPGLFELASGGTIFLDEIGDTSPGLQKKLLRVLQEGIVRRVGGGEEIPVDVRVLSATNRDLYQEVQSGNFREDLFYRLNVINIQLPALRDRREDIPLLAEHFVREINARSGVEKSIPPEWIDALLGHRWPGNIRELQNEVRRSHALSGATLDPAHLSPRVGGSSPDTSSALSLDTVLDSGSLKVATERFEKQIIEAALKRFRGNRAKVCQTLGIPKTTLYAKIRRYDLE